MESAFNWSDFLSYDPVTGVLSWKVKRPGPKTAVGKEAGSIKHDGRYRSFVLFRKRHYVHRVVWEMTHGPIPADMCIDHIDGNGLNNRLENLRITTLSGNQRNRSLSRNNKSGVPGVYRHKNGFSVYCAGRYVGYFEQFERAVAARKKSEAANGYHPTHGRKAA